MRPVPVVCLLFAFSDQLSVIRGTTVRNSLENLLRQCARTAPSLGSRVPARCTSVLLDMERTPTATTAQGMRFVLCLTSQFFYSLLSRRRHGVTDVTLSERATFALIVSSSPLLMQLFQPIFGKIPLGCRLTKFPWSWRRQLVKLRAVVKVSGYFEIGSVRRVWLRCDCSIKLCGS